MTVALLAALAAAAAAFMMIRPVPVPPYDQTLGFPRADGEAANPPALPIEIVFAEGRRQLLSRQENGEVVAWDLQSGASELVAETEGLFGFCPADAKLIVSQAGGAVLIDLNIRSEQRIAAGEYRYAVWSDDCARFALAGDRSRGVEVWDAAEMRITTWIETEDPVRNGLAMSGDGRLVAAAQGTYDEDAGHVTAIEVFELDGAIAWRRLRYADDHIVLGIWRLLLDQYSRRLLFGTQIAGYAGLRSVQVDERELVWSRSGFRASWVRGLALSPGGRLLASGDDTGFLRLWNAATGELLYEGQFDLVIRSVAFSGDGERLAVGLWDSTIKLLELDRLLP